jgi:hypothetical protein
MTRSVLDAFIFLDGDKSPATILTFTQITFFFFVTNPTENIELYPKTGSFTAVWTKFSRHVFTP